MRILITDKLSQAGLQLLEEDSQLQVDVKTHLSPRELVESIGDYDALIVRSATKVTSEVIEHARQLKIIGRAGAGVDNVDVEAATRHGIVVMNTPGGNSTSVAEHAFALMLALARQLTRADASMKRGEWDKKSFLGNELRNKILGIVGFGKIGSALAHRALAFQMKVMAFDPYVPDRFARDQGVSLVPLDVLLSQADFLSLHLASTAETHHFMDEAKFRQMKPTARLINCARGEVLDENALYQALLENRIAGAALDVYQEEPPRNLQLLKLANVICTPHIGASTVEAQEAVGVEIADHVRTFLKSGLVQNAVNAPSISTEERRRMQPFLTLAERLGTFIATIAEGKIQEVGIRYYGELVHQNSHYLTNYVLTRLLKHASDRINAVNARLVAEERGIAVLETKSTRQRHFPNLISLKVRLDTSRKDSGQEEWIEGTVLLGPSGITTDSSFRVVSVDGIDVEAPLAGHVLFFRNEDTPGVIGNVGSTLGRMHINIAGFTLGRDENRKMAVGLVNIDDEISEETIRELQQIPAIRFLRVVRF